MRLPYGIGLTLRAARLVLASLAVAILFAGCGGGSGPGPMSPGMTGSTGAVKVALLLPLTGSGNTPGVAKALKQAARCVLVVSLLILHASAYSASTRSGELPKVGAALCGQTRHAIVAFRAHDD